EAVLFVANEAHGGDVVVQDGARGGKLLGEGKLLARGRREGGETLFAAPDNSLAQRYIVPAVILQAGVGDDHAPGTVVGREAECSAGGDVLDVGEVAGVG